MQITIHRGLSQIGGCITEISTATSRIFIDMGDNLPCEEAMSNADKREFVRRLFASNVKENEAVFYTHAHADHIGMIAYVPGDVPQYMSEGTKKHCQLKYGLLSTLDAYENQELHDLCETHLATINRAKVIKPYREEPARTAGRRGLWLSNSERVGNITVKAYAVPHSAYGSIMLLVEADGKRVLHTGDFKREGLGVDFMEQIRRIGQVDVVITEGTMLKRAQTITTENDVRRQMVDVMKNHKYVFVLTSSLNIDRLSSAALAAKECNKPLTACSSMMLRSIKGYMEAMPDKFCKDVKFYPFKDRAFDIDVYDEVIKEGVEHGQGKIRATSEKMMTFEKWVADKGYVQCVGIGQLEKVRETLALYDPKDCALIYSLWQGYYKIPAQVRLNPKFQEFRGIFEHVYDIHTSGHADPTTIAEMLTLLNPIEGIIGIHKEADASLSTLDIPEELKAKIIPERQTLDYVTIERVEDARNEPTFQDLNVVADTPLTKDFASYMESLGYCEYIKDTLCSENCKWSDSKTQDYLRQIVEAGLDWKLFDQFGFSLFRELPQIPTLEAWAQSKKLPTDNTPVVRFKSKNGDTHKLFQLVITIDRDNPVVLSAEKSIANNVIEQCQQWVRDNYSMLTALWNNIIDAAEAYDEYKKHTSQIHRQ